MRFDKVPALPAGMPSFWYGFVTAASITAYCAGGGPNWKIQHDAQPKWVNPLIGWTSTGDALENVARQLYFGSKEEAVAFAEKNGWSYEVQEYHEASKARPKRYVGYGDK